MSYAINESQEKMPLLLWQLTDMPNLYIQTAKKKKACSENSQIKDIG